MDMENPIELGFKKDNKWYKLVIGKARYEQKGEYIEPVYYVQIYAYEWDKENKDFESRKMVFNGRMDSVDILWETKERVNVV